MNVHHTAPPWRIRESKFAPDIAVLDDRTGIIAEVFDRHGPTYEDHKPEETRPNALLIAAAPDLFTAAEEAEGLLSYLLDHSASEVLSDRLFWIRLYSRAFRVGLQIRDAIAKAKGES